MLSSNCEASSYEGIIVVKLFALAFWLGKKWLDDPYQSRIPLKREWWTMAVCHESPCSSAFRTNSQAFARLVPNWKQEKENP